MNIKTLNILEYNKVVQILCNNCVTFIGKSMANEIMPSTNVGIVDKLLQETDQMLILIARCGDLPICEIFDINNQIKQAQLGYTMSHKDIFETGRILKLCSDLKKFIAKDFLINSVNIIKEYFYNIFTNKDLQDEISFKLLSEDEVSNNATPKLSLIRNNIKMTEANIKQTLNDIIHSEKFYNMIQDNIITIRMERYVVPIKLEFKEQFSGIVHDISQSGQTVFMEPISIMKLNNSLKELRIQEQVEINNILVDLSNKVLPYVNNILENINLIGKIDLINAKAIYAKSINGIAPKLNTNKRINLKNAKHPFIDKNTVVPIDISIGDNYTILAITGPNTGGKTVALKTIGLLTLMVQSGIFIPVSQYSEMFVFESIYVDIGDEQSIDQNLSTFSSHIKNIINILDNVNENSLVLLDELGSGTDPKEGANLAIAIMESLQSKNLISIITTHYTEVKMFVAEKEGLMNASCEFDINTLQPTYKLNVGMPGKSYALVIAEKLGMNKNVIEFAKKLSDNNIIKFEDIFNKASLLKNELESKIKEYNELIEDMEKSNNILKANVQAIENEKNSILQESRNQIKHDLNKAQNEIQSILKNAKSINNKESIKKDLNKIIELQKDIYIATPLKNDVKKGDRVYLKEYSNFGEVLTNPDQYNNVYVQAGIIKLQINIDDTNKVDKQLNKSKININVKNNKIFNTEINLIGKSSDEAIYELEKYINDALVNDIHKISVVHGKGTGILKKSIHSYLKKCTFIKSYRLGLYGEGDSGVTIIEL